MKNELMKDGVTVVAGGGSGIGRAAVEVFAESGSAVEFCSIDAAANESLEQEMRAQGYDVVGTTIDASSTSAVENYLAQVAQRRGRVSALVNSIGIQRYGTSETTSDETWDEVMDVNMKSIFLMVKYTVPLLRANGGGAIVNVSSGQALASQRNVVAYTASKGAIVAMTRAMAVDYALEGIRVNSVCPGSIDTPMLRASARAMNPDDPDGVIKDWGRAHPIGRVGQPREVANACLFLASSLSSFITGTDLRVDGGTLSAQPMPAPED
jgi:NAD(P)-dependent dehydrogenase (short-subunit alcohol dehydrogenase family)